MKKVIIACLLFICYGASSAFAEESSGNTADKSNKDWRFTVSVKFWDAIWEPHNAFGYTASTTGIDKAATFVPTFTARYKDFMASYAIPQMLTKHPYFKNGTAVYEGARQEQDFSIGYYVIPSLAVIVGKKTISNDFTARNDIGAGAVSQSYTLDAPIIGVAGYNQMGDSANIFYYTVALGIGVKSTESPTLTQKVNGRNYLAFELGSIIPISDHVAMTAGYRSQYSSLTLEGNSAPGAVNVSGVDFNLQGFAMGLSYTF